MKPHLEFGKRGRAKAGKIDGGTTALEYLTTFVKRWWPGHSINGREDSPSDVGGIKLNKARSLPQRRR
jgi:hypothetical protein